MEAYWIVNRADTYASISGEQDLHIVLHLSVVAVSVVDFHRVDNAHRAD
jgi:hypothetical protein